MEWYEEWNDIQNIEKILIETGSLAEPERKSYLKEIIQKEKILFRTTIGKAFLKEYKIIVSESLDISFDEFFEDIEMMQKIIKLGIYSKEDIWEKLFAVLEKKKKIQFNTSLGNAFLELYAEKIKLRENTNYKNLQYDFEQMKKIYQIVDFDDSKIARKITLFLTEKKDRIFTTWLGQSFLEKLQNEYLAEEKNKNLRIRKFTKIVVYMLLCSTISFTSIGMYIKIQSIKKYNDLQNKKEVIGRIENGFDDKIFNEKTENTVNQMENEKSKEDISICKPEILEEYEEIASEYPNFVGWLTISDTRINYPVMQSLDDGYYLKHDYTGEESKEGSLFVDGQSSLYPVDNLIVIYGHNVKNGDMFGTLDNYESEDYLKEHKIIQFDSRYEKRKYEIVAVLKTHILYQEENGFRYYQMFGYQDESEFFELVDFIKQNELYDMGEELVYGDEMLMLSTCEYSQENGRLVVVGRMK